MNANERRVLLPLLKRIQKGEAPSFRMRSAAQYLIHRFSKPASKSKKAARVRKEGKAAERQAHNAETSVLRLEALERSGLRCECGCGRALDARAEMDHFYGRSRGQSIQTVWMLFAGCHGWKTGNFPERAYWDEKFEAFCKQHGYPFRPRIVKETAA